MDHAGVEINKRARQTNAAFNSDIPGCSISVMVITCEWMLETFVLLKPNKGNTPILS
jgi:hypothetical protein